MTTQQLFLVKTGMIQGCFNLQFMRDWPPLPVANPYKCCNLLKFDI
jgi:hypothetical protein